jgi:hypothetical protein
MSDRERQGWTIMLLLAAMDAIDFKARAEKLPSFDGYAFSGEDLPTLLEPIADSHAGIVLEEFFTDTQPANLVLVDQVSSVIRELRDGLEQAIKEFEQEFGYLPEAASDEPVDVQSVLQDMISEGEKAVEQVVDIVNSAPDTMMSALPAVGMNEKDQVEVDTGTLNNLVPDTTIDPRDGTYESDNAALQAALDVVSVVDAQVPSEIRSTATDTYNNLVDQVKHGGQP